ncbi:MAG TPA: hypothetical protein VG248_11830 [Caulobacteraceae bacterium]|jgi:hypothetical protein|nr:hypothetical protein [Caulobacteraceae bacterium]
MFGRMMPFGLGGALVYYGFALIMCVHAVRSNQATFWLWIILMFPPLGGLAYLVAIVLPQAFGVRAQRLGAAARASLDPGRDYRHAAAQVDQTPTVQNKLNLAKAAAALGRWAEAEQLFHEAASGIHASDPVLLLGRAQALVELARYDAALEVLSALQAVDDAAPSPQATLVMARAYEGLDRLKEAEQAYRWSVERLPGLEALSRWAVFLAHTGRVAEARETITEMDRHIDRAAPQFRKEYRALRDLAARAL